MSARASAPVKISPSHASQIERGLIELRHACVCLDDLIGNKGGTNAPPSWRWCRRPALTSKPPCAMPPFSTGRPLSALHPTGWIWWAGRR